MNAATLICFAVREEAAPFRQHAAHRAHARILITGMGAANAEASIRTMLDSTRPDVVITAGFAGGLHPELASGTVVYCADDDFPWRERLNAIGISPGRFTCSARIAVTRAEKEQLRNSTGADAVEMESAVIRQICRAAGVPSATIRAISDAAHESLPLNFNGLMTRRHRLHFPKLLWHVARQPGSIPGLLALARQSRRAAQKLAAALDAVIPR